MYPRLDHRLRPTRSTSRRAVLRRGVTAVELLMALTVMVLVTSAVATLANAVQVSNEYGQNAADDTQHARVAIERVGLAVQQAYATASEPGLVVLEHREDGWWFADTLVVWRPGGKPAHADGPPLMRELVVFCPDPDDPRRLVEITAPGDGSTASLATLNTPDGRTRIEAVKRAATSEKVVLTDRLRVAATSDGQRGVVWFHRRVRPSVAQWEAWQAGALGWEEMDWPLGLYGPNHGIRQLWLRLELQMDGADGGREAATPYFGSATLNYLLKR